MKISKNSKPKYIPVTHVDAPEFKRKAYLKQNGVCPVLKKPVDASVMVLDHKHKRRKTDPIGKDGAGLIRGLIHNSVNQAEGVISSAYVRFGVSKHIGLPDFLRNLADYLENPPLGYTHIHPNELPKTKVAKLTKTEYNLIAKHWGEIAPKKTLIEYHNKLRKQGVWLDWLEKANICKGKRK